MIRRSPSDVTCHAAPDGSPEEQVQLVNVVVLRVDGGWLVDDAAF